MAQRRTLAKTVEAGGMGLHTGVESQVRLVPADSGHGLVLLRTDVPPEAGVFRLAPGMVEAVPLCTRLKNAEGTKLSTVEHLLAALAGLGVSDLLIEVEGPEVPILDGSALPWVALIDEAGRVALDGAWPALSVAQGTLLEEGPRRLEAWPADAWELAVRIEFAHPMIGVQSFGGVVDEEWFRNEIAPARTFVVEKDLKTAQAWGMAKGASLAGGVLFADDGKLVNSEGLRFRNEPVRHKVLDAMGDLYIAGHILQGRFDLTAPGHAITNRLLRRLVA